MTVETSSISPNSSEEAPVPEAVHNMKSSAFLFLHLALLLISNSLIFAQEATVRERVDALQASLASSKKAIKGFEWVETRVISLKGEEKSRQMLRCYNGADGKVQKIPLTAAPEARQRRGLRARIAEAKKEELTSTMREAVALVKGYSPLEASLLQKARDIGKVSVTPLPDQRTRLTFNDYLKAGDILAIELDLTSNRPLTAKVSSYLDSRKDAITLEVIFGMLENGAIYASTIELEAKAQNLTISVQNSGYRKLSN